jgi:lysophospholipase
MDIIVTADNPAPPGGVVTTLRAVDGMTLRVARWHPDGDALGTVLVCVGRAEFIEKYFETVGELLERRLAVVVFDWRGQGLSGRELDNSRKGHIDDFSLYERDLDAIAEQVLDPFCRRPWFALGHSMGAAILLAQARADRSPFERLALIGPLIDVYGLKFPRAARLLAETLDTIGFGGAYIPGGGNASALRGQSPDVRRAALPPQRGRRRGGPRSRHRRSNHRLAERGVSPDVAIRRSRIPSPHSETLARLRGGR